MHSDWNFKNKLLLLEAEFQYTRKNWTKAALCYVASIKAAHEHKFTHEEAMACELAAIFFLERGQREKAWSTYGHSKKSFEKYGAFAVAKRIGQRIEEEFSEFSNAEQSDVSFLSQSEASSQSSSHKKRQLT